MQRALILASGPVIQPEHIHLEGFGDEMHNKSLDERAADQLLGSALASQAPLAKSHALSDSLSDRERDLILEALKSDNGNRALAAKRLGISPRTLRYKLAKLRDAGVEV